MLRTLLLASSTLALSTAVAQAATCNGLGTTGILCPAGTNDPFVSSADATIVIVGNGATVENVATDGTAVAMKGNDAQVTVDAGGEITNADPDEGGYAITGGGSPDTTDHGLAVLNNGLISSTDRGIAMLGGSDLYVENGVNGRIETREQAVRSQDATGAEVINHGVIQATKGRALQLRGNGASVTNHGTLIGGEEVIEARGDFSLLNTGSIRLYDESVLDEDGVQFAGGTVINRGSIRGTDDGIDMDEGLVQNASGAVIMSVLADGGNGVDVDEVYDDGIIERQNGTVRIENAGLIQGAQAVGSADDATNSIQIVNSGILRGTGAAGRAVGMASGQGDSSIDILSGSVIEGDVVFGQGNDRVSVLSGFDGLLATGVFQGGMGTNVAVFEAFGLDDVLSFANIGNAWSIALDNGTDAVTGRFADFGTWTFGTTSYTTAELQAAMPAVPLPAGFLLLGSALGAVALRRRR